MYKCRGLLFHTDLYKTNKVTFCISQNICGISIWPMFLNTKIFLFVFGTPNNYRFNHDGLFARRVLAINTLFPGRFPAIKTLFARRDLNQIF